MPVYQNFWKNKYIWVDKEKKRKLTKTLYYNTDSAKVSEIKVRPHTIHKRLLFRAIPGKIISFEVKTYNKFKYGTSRV